MRSFLILCMPLVLLGCASDSGPQTAPASATTEAPGQVNTATGPIMLSRHIPYRDESIIAGNIKIECQLNKQLSEFIQSYALEHGIEVVRENKIDSKGPGKVLVVHITNAFSGGNAFIGHRKSTAIAGKLYENGTQIGYFTGLRNSMGGFMGGFKGSCSVLGRTVKALGGDVARWLYIPLTFNT